MRTDFCPDIEGLVESEIDRVLTQYRESPKLLHMMRTYLGQVGAVIASICDLPSFFAIETAVGEQLTFLGKRLGWPRCHCICLTQPVFGFACEGYASDYTLTGFCDPSQVWLDCGPFQESEICLVDDETYRKFLKVRRYQMLGLYSADDLTAAVQTFWGDAAWIVDAGHGRVVVGPGRALSPTEESLLQLYPRVLPIAPGVQVRFHFGTRIVFGFGLGWGGFCEPLDESLPLTTADEILVTEDATEIMTGPLVEDADWMCETDVRPYDCAGTG